MRRHRSGEILTYTVFDDSSSPDAEQSRIVAGHLGTRHRETVPEFQHYLDNIAGGILAAEQPFSVMGLPLFMLGRQASSEVTCCMTGDGADVLLGGMNEHFDPGAVRARVQNGLTVALRLDLSPAPEVTSLVESLSAAVDPDDSVNRVHQFNLHGQFGRGWLEMCDKLAMAAGVRMSIPFLDDAVVDTARTMPLNFKVNTELNVRKYILRRAALKVFGRATITSALRQKVSLSAAYTGHMTQFTSLCSSKLANGYLEKHELSNCFLALTKGRKQAAARNLLLFDLFCLIFVNNRGAVPEAFDLIEFIQSRSSPMASAGRTV